MLKHIRKKKHPKAHPISDHAIVQFLHRSQIIDIKAMRRQLMTKDLKKALQLSKNNLDAIYQHNENGLQYIVRGGSVVTIMTYDDVRAPNGELMHLEPGTHQMFQA